MKLSDINPNAADLSLEAILSELTIQHQTIAAQASFLREEYALSDELYSMINDVQFRLAAAKRGLGLVNKLSPGPSKAKHASRVLSNMNSIRSLLARTTRALQAQLDTERNSTISDDQSMATQHDMQRQQPNANDFS